MFPYCTGSDVLTCGDQQSGPRLHPTPQAQRPTMWDPLSVQKQHRSVHKFCSFYLDPSNTRALIRTNVTWDAPVVPLLSAMPAPQPITRALPASLDTSILIWGCHSDFLRYAAWDIESFGLSPNLRTSKQRVTLECVWGMNFIGE